MRCLEGGDEPRDTLTVRPGRDGATWMSEVSGPFPHHATSGGGRRSSAAVRKGNRRSAGHVSLWRHATGGLGDTVLTASARDVRLIEEGGHGNCHSGDIAATPFLRLLPEREAQHFRRQGLEQRCRGQDQGPDPHPAL